MSKEEIRRKAEESAGQIHDVSEDICPNLNMEGWLDEEVALNAAFREIIESFGLLIAKAAYEDAAEIADSYNQPERLKEKMTKQNPLSVAIASETLRMTCVELADVIRQKAKALGEEK